MPATNQPRLYDEDMVTASWPARAARAAPAWSVSVGGTWILSTLLLAELARHDLAGSLTRSLIHSAAVCAVACLAIGGPSTAIALIVRQTRSLRAAVTAGLAAACAAFIIIFAGLNDGLTAVSGIAPVALILAVEFAAAFALLRHARKHQSSAG